MCFDTKSTGAKGILMPKSAMPREEGGLAPSLWLKTLIHPNPEVLGEY